MAMWHLTFAPGVKRTNLSLAWITQNYHNIDTKTLHPATLVGSNKMMLDLNGVKKAFLFIIFYPNGLPPTDEKGFGVAGAENLPASCWSIFKEPKAAPSLPKPPTPW
jgi:hypothetical protein